MSLPIIITEDGFILEQVSDADRQADPLLQAFVEDRYRALYHLAWTGIDDAAALTLHFLKSLSVFVHDMIGSTADIEFLRDKADYTLEDDKLLAFLNTIPFMQGSEFINRFWIDAVCKRILPVFRSEISKYPGKVAHY